MTFPIARHLNAILVDKKVVVEPDIMKWAKWYETPKSRIVAQARSSDTLVSTVFLAVDHGYGDKPLWFETMIFGPEFRNTEYQTRCETWDEALEMHKVGCEVAFGHFKEN